MYLDAESAHALAAEVADQFGAQTGIAIFPSAEVLQSITHVLEGTEISLGAQTCGEQRSGAHTGELSADNLKSVGCHYVLVGHSERRAMGETDVQINTKMKSALAAGLTPVLCVGETEKEHQAGQAHTVVKAQLEAATDGIEDTDYLVAYEPVWAIGTGTPATADDASQMCRFVKDTIGQWCVVLYGGSVDAKSVQQYVALDSVDGFLVGGASTTREKLFPIVESLL